MPSAELRRTYEMIGRMTAAWNDVDLLWELIFTCILHEPPRATTDVLLQHVHRPQGAGPERHVHQGQLRT